MKAAVSGFLACISRHLSSALQTSWGEDNQDPPPKVESLSHQWGLDRREEPHLLATFTQNLASTMGSQGQNEKFWCPAPPGKIPWASNWWLGERMPCALGYTCLEWSFYHPELKEGKEGADCSSVGKDFHCSYWILVVLFLNKGFFIFCVLLEPFPEALNGNLKIIFHQRPYSFLCCHARNKICTSIFTKFLSFFNMLLIKFLSVVPLVSFPPYALCFLLWDFEYLYNFKECIWWIRA